MTNPDPAFVARNVKTLSVIGGVYDLIALEVYETHRVLLTEAGFPSYDSIVEDLRSNYSGIPIGSTVFGSGRDDSDSGSLG